MLMPVTTAIGDSCAAPVGKWPDGDLIWPDMAWAKPQYSKGQVDKAGQTLIEPLGPLYPVNWEEALQIINNWRSSHSYALQSLKMGLIHRAHKVDEKTIVAQRLKRLSSIDVKLRRNAHMKLTQMQDIGGCRGIVRSVRALEKLVRMFDPLEHSKKYDYIAEPKTDGYRSIHFVRKYVSNLRQNQAWIGLRIEIQLRTRLQHAWATAVETVDIFSRQRIKTGGGEERWRRFFVLMSSAIAIREGKPIVPGTPSDQSALTKELRDIVKELRVISVLNGWATALRHLPVQAKSGAQAFLLVLNAEENTLQIMPFTDEESARASEEYLNVERDIQRRSDVQAVLVSVKSAKGLQSAYPNYFADTRTFIQAIELAIS
jgi:Region found in RelA / SpoT proteins